MGTGSGFDDGGEQRHEGGVDAAGRSARSVEESASDGQPLRAIETGGIGTEQRPAADGQQGDADQSDRCPRPVMGCESGNKVERGDAVR